MKAKIYQPAKSATQSAKNEFWLLEFNSQDKPIIDEKMLLTSSSNTQDKVKIKFSDKDKAIKFANNNNVINTKLLILSILLIILKYLLFHFIFFN